MGVSDAGFARLRAVLAGEVLEPGTPGYEAARKPAMPRFWDIRPRVVVRAASAEDVTQTLAFAATSGLPVVPRGGGHCFAGRSSTDGIVLDLTLLRQVRAAADGAAVIGAGARLAEVYDGLDEHGLTIPAGCGPDVGIAGLTLGGGLGSRRCLPRPQPRPPRPGQAPLRPAPPPALPPVPLTGRYREWVAKRGPRVPIGERVTQAHLDHFCPGGVGLPVTDSGPIGLGPVGDPPAGTEVRAARRASPSCARCGASITPAQDARRRITGTWVHEACPP